MPPSIGGQHMCRQPSSPLLSGSDGLNEPDVPVDGARVAAALTVLIETVQRYVSDAEAPVPNVCGGNRRWPERTHYDVGISKKVTGDGGSRCRQSALIIEFRLGRAPVARWRFIGDLRQVEQFT